MTALLQNVIELQIILCGVDMMKLLCSFVLLLVMVLSLVGCDSVDTVYVVPSDNDPYSLENRELRIGVDLDSSMVLVAASVDVLDDSLKKIRSVESRAIGGFRQWYKKDGWSFEVAEQNYESSYLKVSYTCVLPNGDSATFVDYVDIAWEMYPTFYLIQSLRKYRIESLVKKEKFPLYTAIRIANRDLLEFFSFSSALDIESQEKHLAWIKEYPYLYGGYYLSNPDFVGNFEAIAKDFDRVLTKNKKVSALDTVEMVDNALFSGQMDILFRDSHYWTAYGFPYCDSTRRDSVVFNNVKGSYYKDSLFKCDGRAWRKIAPRSSSSSVMSSSSSSIKYSSSSSSNERVCEEDSVRVDDDGHYYVCVGNSWKWMNRDERIAYIGKAYEEKYGSCQNDPWNRSIVYVDEADGFMGCAEKEDKIAPDVMAFVCCHSIDSIENGYYKDSKTYEISDFGFKWIFGWDKSYSVWSVNNFFIDSLEYDPSMSKDGEDLLLFVTPFDWDLPYNVLVDSLFDLSENDRALVDVVESYYTRYYSSYHPLVKWEDALENCPNGFEIPDTTSLRYHYEHNENSSYWNEGVFMNFNSDHVTYFWTSQKVNDTTRICGRLLYMHGTGKTEIDFVECPVDAGVVQAVYSRRLLAGNRS